jgi:uncharacterized protein involved in exopolysaccharide biosynthesis
MLWSGIAWIIACLSIGFPAALVLVRYLGSNAWKAGLIVGAFTLVAFAATQYFIVLPPTFQLRAWLLNLLRAATVPILAAALGASNKK